MADMGQINRRGVCPDTQVKRLPERDHAHIAIEDIIGNDVDTEGADFKQESHLVWK